MDDILDFIYLIIYILVLVEVLIRLLLIFNNLFRFGEVNRDLFYYKSSIRISSYCVSKILGLNMVWLRLARGTQHGYRLLNMSDLDIIRAGLYQIKRKIGKVAFELELPDNIKIHLIISYIYLDFYHKDPYNCQNPAPAPIIIENKKWYLINRILKKS